MVSCSTLIFGKSRPCTTLGIDCSLPYPSLSNDRMGISMCYFVKQAFYWFISEAICKRVCEQFYVSGVWTWTGSCFCLAWHHLPFTNLSLRNFMCFPCWTQQTNGCLCFFCSQEHWKCEDHQCGQAYVKDVRVPVCPLCNKPVPINRGEDPNIKVTMHYSVLVNVICIMLYVSEACCMLWCQKCH